MIKLPAHGITGDWNDLELDSVIDTDIVLPFLSVRPVLVLCRHDCTSSIFFNSLNGTSF